MKLALLVALFASASFSQSLRLVEAKVAPCVPSGTAYAMHADQWRLYLACQSGTSMSFFSTGVGGSSGIAVLDNRNLGLIEQRQVTSYPAEAIAGDPMWLVTTSNDGSYHIHVKGHPLDDRGNRLSKLEPDYYWRILSESRGDLIVPAIATHGLDIFTGVLYNPDVSPHGYLAVDGTYVYVTSGNGDMEVYNRDNLFAKGARNKTAVFNKKGDLIKTLSNETINCPGIPFSDGEWLLRSCPELIGTGFLATKVATIGSENPETHHFGHPGVTIAKTISANGRKYIVFGTRNGEVWILRAEPPNFEALVAADLFSYGNVNPTEHYRVSKHNVMYATDLQVQGIEIVGTKLFVLTRPRGALRNNGPRPALFVFEIIF